MNLQEIDLFGLTKLWQAASSNLEFRRLIEAEIQKRVLLNNRFSREYLFQISKMQNHAITISFIPTTDSYLFFGENITVEIILSDEEMKEMLNNSSAVPPIQTGGQVKAKTLLTDGFSKEKTERLETIGFHTREILETSH